MSLEIVQIDNTRQINDINTAFHIKADILVNGIYIDPSVQNWRKNFKERMITLYAPDEHDYEDSIPYEIKLMDFKNESITF